MALLIIRKSDQSVVSIRRPSRLITDLLRRPGIADENDIGLNTLLGMNTLSRMQGGDETPAAPDSCGRTIFVLDYHTKRILRNPSGGRVDLIPAIELLAGLNNFEHQPTYERMVHNMFVSHCAFANANKVESVKLFPSCGEGVPFNLPVELFNGQDHSFMIQLLRAYKSEKDFTFYATYDIQPFAQYQCRKYADMLAMMQYLGFKFNATEIKMWAKACQL